MRAQTPTRHDGRPAPLTDGRDVACAAGAGLVAFGVYVRTLAPGLVGVLDTPMFQFVGRVLGVAHNPGYPLYVLLTFPFSYLPIGSLAYRINLFSALLGAIAVALTFLLARQLACRRPIALAAALGLAFGQVFWSQAVIAEVYTLHAALIAGVLLALVVWAHTGRAAYYYAAAVLFAAGLGNHTTIVGFAPGMAIFALLTSPAFVLRWRTLVATAAILGIGLLQYAFILVRSLDPGAYVESRATTVAELIDVMMAGQFRDRLFTFSWRAILFDRLPFLFERVIIPELTWPALAAAVVGACWLLRRRLPAAQLLLSGTAAILAFAVNYSVVDTPVFVIPAILVLWIAAAVGAEQAARVVESLERRVSVVRGWRAAALIAATTLLVPAWLLADNFAASDRSRETTSATYLDALFDALPERSALVHEDFLVDRMVMSRLLDEAFPTDRRVDLVNRNDVHVRRSLAAGHRVFGFRKSARRLRYDALDFGFAPVPLMGGPFNEFVSYLPRGAAIVLGVPTPHAARGLATDVSAAAVGGTATADLTIGGGQRIGNSGVVAPAAIEVHADAAGAVIRVGGRDVVRAFDGPAVAVFAPDGKLDDAFVLQADSNFRVPLPIGPLSIYPLRGDWRGENVGQDEWSDVTMACRTGSVLLQVPPGGTAVLYVADDRPLEPRTFDKSQDRISARTIEVTPGLGPRGHLYRLEIGVPGSRSASVLLALGGVPAHAFARLRPSPAPARPATIFSIDTAGLLRTPDRRSEVLLMARDEQSQLTGDGWSAVDFDVVGPYRWMTASESALVLPVAATGHTHVRLQALQRPDRAGSTRLALRLNETMLPAQLIQPGWHAYEWSVPEGALHEGTNEMAIIVDRVPQERTVAVFDVRLERRVRVRPD